MPVDANGQEIVYVQKPNEDGSPGQAKPALANMLHYAMAQGYKPCDEPGKTAEPETVAPDLTPDDVAEDNSAAIEIKPEPTPRRRGGRW